MSKFNFWRSFFLLQISGKIWRSKIRGHIFSPCPSLLVSLREVSLLLKMAGFGEEMNWLEVVSTLIFIFTIYSIFKRFFGGGNSQRSPPASRDVKITASEEAETEEEDEGNKTPLKIFFGSQTGTAEDFANTLCDEGLAYGFAPEVIDMEEFDMDDMVDTELALFCLATYGEGEPPDNARSFYTWMKEEEHDDDTLQKYFFLPSFSFLSFLSFPQLEIQYLWVRKQNLRTLQPHGKRNRQIARKNGGHTCVRTWSWR